MHRIPKGQVNHLRPLSAVSQAGLHIVLRGSSMVGHISAGDFKFPFTTSIGNLFPICWYFFLCYTELIKILQVFVQSYFRMSHNYFLLFRGYSQMKQITEFCGILVSRYISPTCIITNYNKIKYLYKIISLYKIVLRLLK